MKTTTTIKQTLLALTIALSIVSCKKDKKSDPAPTPQQAITFEDLLKLSTGASVKAPDNTKITGIVISDVSNKNIDPKTVVLQEATGKAGIVVTFTAAQTFALGDQVDVNISGQTLAQINGEVELTNIPAANAKKNGTGTVAPATTNAAAIIKNVISMDGTLVTIPANSLTGGNGKYTGTLTVADTTGTLPSNVLAGAAFENTAYPVSVAFITGIVRVDGTTVRIDIRKPADVVTGAITRLLTDDFTNISPPPAVDIDFNPASYGSSNLSAITTAAGAWTLGLTGTSNSYYWLFPGSKYDGSFTTTGKNYLYNFSLDNFGNQSALTSTFTKLAGLKTVSVTFAGSNLSGVPTTLDLWSPQGDIDQGAPNYLNIYPFNASTDYFQISITPTVGVFNQQINNYVYSGVTSAKYTKAGQFYTVTWTVPTHDQLVAQGVSDADATAWIANPQIQINNLSIRAADPNTQYNQPKAPILFDKVVFGF